MSDPVTHAASATLGRVAHAVGPIPLLAIAGGVVGGLYLLHRSRSGEPSSAADDAAGATDSTLSPAWAGTPGTPSYLVVGNPAAGGIATGSSSATGAPEPADNFAWQRKAEIQLIALGYDPITVEAALSQYLQGQSLTQQQGAIVNLALSKFGPPPNPPPAPIVQPPAPTPQPVSDPVPTTPTTPVPVAAPQPTPITYYTPGGPILGPILVPTNPALPIRTPARPVPATRQL